MLHLLTPLHWKRVQEELTHPSEAPVISNDRVPKYQFGTLPASLDAEVWTVAEFASRGFPVRNLPTTVPNMVLPEQWDAAVMAGLQKGVLDRGWLPALKTVRGWMTLGCPEYLKYPGTLHTNTPHFIGPEEMAMAVETLAQFQYQVSSDVTLPLFQIVDKYLTSIS